METGTPVKKCKSYKYLPYTLQCRSVDVTVNHCKSLFTFSTVLGAVIKCKQYSGIIVESGTQIKKCKNYIEYICSVSIRTSKVYCINFFQISSQCACVEPNWIRYNQCGTDSNLRFGHIPKIPRKCCDRAGQ